MDPDQTLHSVASDLGLHCLQRPVCHNTSGYYGTPFILPVEVSKTAGLLANSVDPDEMPHSVVSDLGLHCLLRPVYPNSYIYYCSMELAFLLIKA